MNTHQLLLNNGYSTDDPGFGDIAEKAHNLINNDGMDPQKALEKIDREYSRPEDKLTFSDEPQPIKVYGEIGTDIDQQAYDQLEKACRLPVAITGALLPDAHLGYALPVGGVVALKNAVSPAFVGFDIACRMKMSILNISVEAFEERRRKLVADLDEVTAFGLGANFGFNAREHPVQDDPRWTQIERARELKEKADRQLGSSGSGNHFADLMTGTVQKEKDWLPLDKGERFVALVTHSGSRGTGHKLATHYKNIAEEHTQRISKGISKSYAWLDLDTEAGQEYWQAMQLMGDYASANHELIHKHFAKESGLDIVDSYENHHNFAWEKEVKGEKWIIHRKGATPAEEGVVGIIPGSMGTPSYLVEGKAGRDSLWSSAHGAGRISSRTQAKKDHDAEAYKKFVKEKDILTIRVAKDETYQSYKDIGRVMELQEGELVETVAEMKPRVVVMGGGRGSDDGD
jgi:tRNA-splicing ligase RtcB